MRVVRHLPFGTDRILWGALMLFFAISVVGSLRPTVAKFRRLWEATRRADAHTLRREYHSWYDRQHPVWEYIAENVPEGVPIVVATENVRPQLSQVQPHFVAYYLAPRAVYEDSQRLRRRLGREGRAYALVTLRWDGASREHEWEVEMHGEMPGAR